MEDLIKDKGIHVCKRINNKKRNYLLVNENQGKHMATRASTIYSNVSKLVNKVLNCELSFDTYNRKNVIIGFAETATGIGAMFSKLLEKEFPGACLYITTTRSDICGDTADFIEEHSHAVEQKLFYNGNDEYTIAMDMFCKKDGKFNLIFVEDEITTGNTIKNAVEVLKRYELLDNCVSITVASFLNGMTKEQEEDFKKNKINFEYLTKIKTKAEFTEEANNIEFEESVKNDKASWDIGSNTYMSNGLLANFIEIRSPQRDIRYGMRQDDYTIQTLRMAVEVTSELFSRELLGKHSRKVRVIGTEECMFPAIELSMYLELMCEDVKTHSTTRSPIETHNNAEYGIKSSFKFKSCYRSDGFIYSYNALEEDRFSDLVIIVTDSNKSKEQSYSLIELITFYKEYCQAKEVVVVRGFQ